MVVSNRRVFTLPILLTVAVLAVLSLTVPFGSNRTIASATTPTTTTSSGIPNFEGMNLAGARTLAAKDHGSVFVEVTIPSSASVGTVIGQGPNAHWPVPLVVSSGPWRNDWAVLPGTHDAPVKKECAVPILLTEDGNAYPLLCRGGRVNVGAWLFYEQLRPSIMAIARSATPRQAFTQMCNLHPDTPIGFNLNLTLTEYEDSFSLAAAYNGWRSPAIARWVELTIQNVSPSKCVAELLKAQ